MGPYQKRPVLQLQQMQQHWLGVQQQPSLKLQQYLVLQQQYWQQQHLLGQQQQQWQQWLQLQLHLLGVL
ncbi:hypothetical protein GPECTOR_159g113 [Gonium pectorale]|uniref:Uncharacterized protein n=1 Tax=Gonium pectorale TaxID=33097 RepID=A0A150FYR2_GONPE|nr:hypothetical protein GPECTOR_159g113 [Gonium pectorale]|eukprot:KXZ42345.1 hypothetical protein GPECTOR_159g113 [Gonium pectorale]